MCKFLVSDFFCFFVSEPAIGFQGVTKEFGLFKVVLVRGVRKNGAGNEFPFYVHPLSLGWVRVRVGGDFPSLDGRGKGRVDCDWSFTRIEGFVLVPVSVVEELSSSFSSKAWLEFVVHV